MAEKKIVPLFGRVLVQPVEPVFSDEERRIITPDTAQERPEYGVVVAAAEDCTVVAEGDLVQFGRYSGYGLHEDQYISLREIDLMAKLEGYRWKPRTKENGRPESQLITG